MSRRTSPNTRVIITLSWLLAMGLLYTTYDAAMRARSDPRLAGLDELLVIPGLLMAFFIGIPAAWRQAADRRWFAFLKVLPLSPLAVLICWWIERFVRVGICALFIGAYTWGFSAAHTLSVACKVTLLVFVASMVLGGLQILAVVVVRTASGGQKVLLSAVLLILVTGPFAKDFFSPSPTTFTVEHTLRQIHSHAIVRATGFDCIARLGQADAGWMEMMAGLGELLARVLCCGLMAHLLLGRRAERMVADGGNGMSMMSNFIVGPINQILRTTRISWMIQSSLELVVQLKQGNVIVTLCTLATISALIIIPMTGHGTLTAAEVAPLVGIIAGMIIGSDGTSEVLRKRSPYRLYRFCGTRPDDFALSLGVSAACLSVLIFAACSPILLWGQPVATAAYSMLSAAMLCASEAALATLIQLYIYPVFPRLGLIGKIKSGIILLLSAYVLLLLATVSIAIPPVLVILLWVTRRGLGTYVQRKIWNADLL